MSQHNISEAARLVGKSRRTLQRLLNHADPRTTRFYDRRRLKVVQQDIEKMDFRLRDHATT